MARRATMKPPAVDLFGEQAVGIPNPQAYAGRPGAGPVGRQCRHCRYYARVQPHDRVYLKCGLVRWRWTADAATDIKASTPACERFRGRKD